MVVPPPLWLWNAHIKLFSASFFFFSSRRRHTRFKCDWSSDVCSSDLMWRLRALLIVTVIVAPYVLLLYVSAAWPCGKLGHPHSETRTLAGRLGQSRLFPWSWLKRFDARPRDRKSVV